MFRIKQEILCSIKANCVLNLDSKHIGRGLEFGSDSPIQVCNTVVPPYLRDYVLRHPPPKACLKLRIDLNPIDATFFPIHAYIPFHVKEAPYASLWYF